MKNICILVFQLKNKATLWDVSDVSILKSNLIKPTSDVFLFPHPISLIIIIFVIKT